MDFVRSLSALARTFRSAAKPQPNFLSKNKENDSE